MSIFELENQKYCFHFDFLLLLPKMLSTAEFGSSPNQNVIGEVQKCRSKSKKIYFGVLVKLKVIFNQTVYRFTCGYSRWTQIQAGSGFCLQNTYLSTKTYRSWWTDTNDKHYFWLINIHIVLSSKKLLTRKRKRKLQYTRIQWRNYRFKPGGNLTERVPLATAGCPLANTQKKLRNDGECGCGWIY